MKPTRILVHHEGNPYPTKGKRFKAVDDWHRWRWNRMCIVDGKRTPCYLLSQKEQALYEWEWMTDEEARVHGTLSSLGFYCGYTEFIEENGERIICREDGETGAHTIGMNNEIGICMAGNYDHRTPPQRLKNALRASLRERMDKWSIPAGNIEPHRKYAKKSCYGAALSDDWARKLVELPPIVLQLIALLRKLGIKV